MAMHQHIGKSSQQPCLLRVPIVRDELGSTTDNPN